MYLETAAAIDTTISLYSNRHKLAKVFEKIYDTITKGRVQIVVFGAGGTGKSTFARRFTHRDIDSFEYKETLNIEQVKFSKDNETWGKLLVAPGQERRVERHWPDIFRTMAKGESVGLVNVVSYGFHSLGITDTSYKETNYFNPDREEFFLEDFLSNRLQFEIKLLKNISTQLKSIPNKKFWMVTFVNKQDLWWNEREDVKKHYINGEYNELINEITHSIGASNFTHEYVSAALVNLNFSVGDDFIVSTSKGYDDAIRTANSLNLTETINSLIHDRKQK